MDEAKRRSEIMARQMFIRFKGLLMEPAALFYAERHDNIEAIRAQTPEVAEESESRFYDLSMIDLEKLQAEFAKKVRRKATVLQDIREIVEKKLTEVEVFILGHLFQLLPSPPFTEQDKQVAAKEVYTFILNASTASAFTPSQG